MKKADKKKIFDKWAYIGFLDNDLGEEFNTQLALMFEHTAVKLLADIEKEFRVYSEQLETSAFPVLHRLATKSNMKMSKREVNKMLKALNSFLTGPRASSLMIEFHGHTNIDMEAELLSEFSENYAKTL